MIQESSFLHDLFLTLVPSIISHIGVLCPQRIRGNKLSLLLAAFGHRLCLRDRKHIIITHL